jgi:polyphosphate glucokinase
LKKLPPGCRAGDDTNGFLGGFRLWQETDHRKTFASPIAAKETDLTQ